MKSPAIFFIMAFANVNFITALQCHRCIFADPYNEEVKHAIQEMEKDAASAGIDYKIPEWSKNCQRSPSHDLNDTLTIHGPLLTHHQAIRKSISMLTKISQKDSTVAVALTSNFSENLIAAPISSPPINEMSLVEPKAVSQFCYEFNVHAKSKEDNLDLTFVYRDGVMAEWNQGTSNKCFDQLDDILNLIGEKQQQDLEQMIEHIQACICYHVDGCNNRDFGHNQGTNLVPLKLVTFLVLIIEIVSTGMTTLN